MRVLKLSVLICVLAGCNATEPEDALEPIQTTHVYFPDTNSAPTELNMTLANGDCHVRVDVLSTGGGTDNDNNSVAFRLFDFQVFSPRVGNLYQQKWGREGEFSTCAQVPNFADIAILKTELNDVLTTYGPPTRGLVTVGP